MVSFEYAYLAFVLNKGKKRYAQHYFVTGRAKNAAFGLIFIYLADSSVYTLDVDNSFVHRDRLSVNTDIVSYLGVYRHRQTAVYNACAVKYGYEHSGANGFSVTSCKPYILYFSLRISQSLAEHFYSLCTRRVLGNYVGRIFYKNIRAGRFRPARSKYG